MIDTITPAVCGGRKRRRIGIAAFAAGAVASAAAVGAALGLAGAALGSTSAIAVAAGLAGLAALRESGLVRFPVPQLPLQVPERWRSELPLPIWSAGYGAGLGVGFLTFQPVSTFWVACAAAVALGRPLAAAACFSLYGAGRALMVALPTWRGADPGDAVVRLVRRRPAVLRANAALLAAAALALALAPVAGAVPIFLGPGNQLDPSPSKGVLAYTQREFEISSVAVRVSDFETIVFPGGRSPSLSDRFLAYEAAEGVQVVRWRTGAVAYRVPGAFKPALDWPWLAYRTDAFDGTRELWLRNLSTGSTRLLTTADARREIGRPSIAAGRVAWHVAGEQGSSIVVYNTDLATRRVLARSKIALLSNPALSDSRVIWVDQRMGRTTLRLRRLDVRRVITLAASHDRDQVFWTTALGGRNAYATRWFIAAGISELERFRF